MSQALLCSKLKDLLVTISEGERNLDRQRELLCELPSFTPYNSFKQLDRLQLNCLTHTDLHTLFSNQKMNFSYEETCLLLRNIDKNNDLKIMFEEWEDLLLCRRKQELREVVLQRGAKESLSKDDRVFSQIVQVLSQIVRNAKDYDICRQRLAATLDYSDLICFNLIDIDRKGFITLQDIDCFLKERGKFLSEEEILLLISFADVDQDDALSFSEFTGLILVGGVAPVQTSPRKSRIIQSPGSSKRSQIVRQQENRIIASPYRSQVSEQYNRIIASPLRTQVSAELKQQQYIQPVQEVQKQQSRIIVSPYRSQVQEQYNRIISSPLRTQVSAEIQYIQPVQQMHVSAISPTKLSRTYQTTRQFSSAKKRIVQQTQMTTTSQQEENELLIQLLKRMIDCDRMLMETKTKLVMKTEFNLMDLFRLFDINQNKNISKLEFEQGINRIEIFPTQDQIYLFFEEFDCNKDELLDFGDFAKIFYTGEKYDLELLQNKQVTYVEPLEGETIIDIFAFDTIQLLKTFFFQLFDSQTSLDTFRENLQLRQKFNLYEAFLAISNAFKELTYEGLKEMLGKYGVVTTENEMVKLFQRMDKDRDGVVKLHEFIAEVKPKSPGRYKK